MVCNVGIWGRFFFQGIPGNPKDVHGIPRGCDVSTRERTDIVLRNLCICCWLGIPWGKLVCRYVSVFTVLFRHHRTRWFLGCSWSFREATSLAECPF